VTKRILNVLKYLLGWPFSILAFFFIIRIIAPQIPSFTKNIHTLQIPLLLSGVIFFVLYYGMRAYIWHRLLRIHTREITFKTSAYLWSLAELRRYIPGNFWALLGRTVLFSDKGVKKKDTGKLVIVEIAVFFIGAASASLLSLPFVSGQLLPWFTRDLQYLVVGLVALMWVGYVFNYKFVPYFPKFEPHESLLLLFLSTIGTIFFGIGSYLTVISFVYLPIHLFFQLSGFFALSFILGFSSLLTPAGFGVREGITITGLSKIIPLASAAVAALFSRIVLVLSELLFIGLIFVVHKTKNKRILQVESWIANHKHETVLLFLFVCYVIYFTLVTFLRHDHFYTGKFDLGNMAQTVWNTTQGRFFQFTNPDSVHNVSRLSTHADFILVLLAPLYALFPSPKTLLFLQTFVVGIGCFFVYWIARDKLKSKSIALAFAFSYLINPGVERANLYDFHAVTLATTFLLAMYYFYQKKRYILFGVFAILAGITKEQIWVIVALFGVLIFFIQKKRLIGSALFLGGFAFSYFLISYAIPNASGTDHFALSYYSELGDGPVGILRTILLSPDKIIDIILQKERIDFLRQILSPVGYLPLIFPFFMLFASPELLISLLSSNPQLHQIYYHYTAAITPFIYLSSIFAVGIILKFLPKSLGFLIILFIAGSALIGAYKYGPLPGARNPNTDMFTKQVWEREYIHAELSKIPSEAVVAASNNVAAHLSNRETVYILPLGLEKADVIVFLLNDSEQPQSLAAQKTQIAQLRKNKQYIKTAEKGAFVVFRKI
jgi:uncharacterized membrane protein/uncharacterized membrane protein YbhN (UPF0104 family)